MSVQSQRGRWHTVDSSDVTQPFLMTIVGASNHWLFVSSAHALTAGRTNAEQAIFAYETVDRLHKNGGRVGPVTAVRFRQGDKEVVWRPFTGQHEGIIQTISKRTLGDGVRFAETHVASGLQLTYEWALSEPYGFVRRCTLELEPGREPVALELVDGLRSIQPHGVDARTQQTASVLVDAYKHTELVEPGVGLYSLASRIVDRPEPAEALRATVAYQHGLPNAVTFLQDTDFVDFYEHGDVPAAGQTLLGKPAGYFVYSQLELAAGESQAWMTGVDIGWSAARVVALRHALKAGDFAEQVDATIEQNRTDLVGLVARADGLQTTALSVRDDRHATNVMFNIMRGGIIATDQIPAADVLDFIEGRNKRVLAAHRASIEALGENFAHQALVDAAKASGDVDFMRLAVEYMPLTFSRRHGDPSRPWNAFNIHIKHRDGSPRYYFEGNWRDVFQNWEAMLLSFPEYAESAWTTFFNASTPDGYNPYRIAREGVDWERPDADDPWAHIGYWGDHQIIYSLKLLEHFQAHAPGELAQKLDDPFYVYADVPYRIARYDQIVADPHETISFDRDHDRVIDRRRESMGGDGNLLHADGELVRGTLAEKLLISLLAKLSNLVVDGGIWMNTQRPEWNDANNALVGNGLSMVTLAYMTRHVLFLQELFGQHQGLLELHELVGTWLSDTRDVMKQATGLDDETGRRKLLDELGMAASRYRTKLYQEGLGAKTKVAAATVQQLLALAYQLLERSLRSARRDDGMFHAYNLLDTRHGGAQVTFLPVMLEGQVAALSSGILSPDETIALAEALFKSPLYREDQNTFLLYPVKTLPDFLDRGIIPESVVSNNPLMTVLAGDTVGVVERDVDGVHRFDGAFSSAKDLAAALRALRTDRPETYGRLIDAHFDQTLGDFEGVFVHRAYTGRSGSMYGYEGIGSIYWHMVSKLNLAMLECTLAAHEDGVSVETVARMARQYYSMRGGLGDAKTFAEYGAFPTDAYSHTPPDGKARQPGMTGQVKEDILTRRGELGLKVVEGELRFDPVLLRVEEFLTEPAEWHGLSASGESISLSLEAGQLAFTVCQVPVVYTLTQGDQMQVTVVNASGQSTLLDGHLERELTQAIFGRTSAIRRIDVAVGRARLCLA